MALLTFTTMVRLLTEGYEDNIEWEKGCFHDAMAWINAIPAKDKEVSATMYRLYVKRLPLYLTYMVWGRQVLDTEQESVVYAILKCLHLLLAKSSEGVDSRHVDVIIALKPFYDGLKEGPLRSDIRFLLESVGATGISLVDGCDDGHRSMAGHNNNKDGSHLTDAKSLERKKSFPVSSR